MKSDLWKQRRETDGSLVNTWNEIRRRLTDDEQMKEGEVAPSQEEETDALWEEELTLSDKERQTLADLEAWYNTSWRETQPDQHFQPEGRPSQEEPTNPTGCAGDQTSTLEPNQPPGRPEKQTGLPEDGQEQQTPEVPDRDLAAPEIAQTIIQPTT